MFQAGSFYLFYYWEVSTWKSVLTFKIYLYYQYGMCNKRKQNDKWQLSNVHNDINGIKTTTSIAVIWFVQGKEIFSWEMSINQEGVLIANTQVSMNYREESNILG